MKFLVLYFFLLLSTYSYAFDLPKDAIISDRYPNGGIKIAGLVNTTDGSITVYQFYENGKISNIGIMTKNKLMNGPYTVFSKKGEILTEGHFVNNKENGIKKQYYENGKIKLLEDFREGIQEGPTKGFYKNSNTLIEGIFKDGKEEGEWKEYYENGNLKVSYVYKNGKKNGVQLHYAEDGSLISKIEFKDGLADGEVFDYAFGTIINKCTYKDGNELGCQKNDLPIPDLLKSKDGISKLDLNNQESLELLTSDWQNSNTPNAWSLSKEKIIELKEKNLLILGEFFVGSFRKRDDGSFDLNFQSMGVENPKFGEMFMKAALQMWGPPLHWKNNNFDIKESSAHFYNLKAQWIFNNIIIEFTFLGPVEKYNLKYVSYLTFGSKNQIPLMTDQVFLRCSVTEQKFGPDVNDNSTEELPDIVFIVDQDDREIYKQNYVSFRKLTSITNDFFVSDLSDDKKYDLFTINRVLGNFNGDSYLMSYPSYKVNISGNCQKIEQKDLTPKF